MKVPPEGRGKRLDVFVHSQFPQLSRSQIKKLTTKGKVMLGGHSAKASATLKGGEELEVVIPPPEPLDLKPEAYPLEILYEDKDLLALNKPAEKVVHPGAGIVEGTLVHAILHHCTDLSGIGGKLRPGIVHRLDKGTSGVLVVAKNDRAHAVLSEQFKSREIKKTYLAFVWGSPEPAKGVIDRPLGRDLKDRKKISPRTAQARSARTSYRVLKTYGPISLVELEPETGRTHQIRVHLTEIRHPVVGDPTYGKGLQKLGQLPEQLQGLVKGFTFQLLHALRLQLQHPTTGQALDLQAPLRPEMQEFKELLEDAFL